MIKRAIDILILSLAAGLIVSAEISAQNKEIREGTVTYLSLQNIYVKFDSTAGISAGDTLFSADAGELHPVIVVTYISSHSVAGELINGGKLKVNDKVTAFAIPQNILETVSEKGVSYFDSLNLSFEEIKTRKKISSMEYEAAEKYRGRFSVQSYTNLSNFDTRGEYQRWRYTFSFNGDNIGGSDFSVTNYMSFAYKADDWSNVSSDVFKSLRIYDLALNYQPDETIVLWLGRHINRRITNISAIDGIQFEKIFNSFTAGLLAGSRPDFSNNMKFNLKLFEFGGYIGRTDSIGKGVMDNNLAIMQQTNNFKTDRRFLYLQHSNNLLPNTSIFLSSEIDLYKKIRGEESSDFILTGLFLSARYSPVKIASFSLSYDARKSVIYYETFKSFVDSVYENETRHGLRFGTNIRPLQYLSIGLNGGYRFRKGDLKPSSNYNGYLSYTSIPFIQTSSTFSYTYITSSYFDGSIYGIRLSKSINPLNVSVSVGYRYTSYKLLSRLGEVIQNTLLTDISVPVIRNLYFNVGFEGIFEKERTSSRILLDFSTRF